MGSSRWGYGAPIKPNPTLGVVLFAALILCSRLPPTGAQTVTVLRNPVIAAQGGNVTLPITVSGDVFVTAWYRGIVDPSNLILRRNPTTILSPPGPKYTFRETILPDYSLVIINATFNYSGEYTVSTTFTSADIDTKTVTLNVMERITNAAVTISTDNIVEYNGSVVLNCSVTGTPETIQWFKDDNVLSINSRIALTQNNQTLTISNVSRDDDGNYRCNASNPINFSASNPQRLTVYYGPDLPQITPSNGVQAQAGSEVTLKCNAASNPIPQYSWQLNETNVSSTAEYVINNISSADQGTYTCVVTNSRTNRNNSASINIIVTAGPGSNNPPGSGLSGGAIAGIVIGCICGCALIGGLVYFLVVKKGAARGNDKHSLNEIKSTAANNTSSVAKDGSVNQSYEGEVQYASPLFKPTKPVETTVLEPEDKTIYSQVNTAKL